MKPTTNWALAEQRALRNKLKGFHDILLMQEAIASVRLSQDDGTYVLEDDEPPAPEETA